jgi:tetratricopeptide (TPR) repeat protein
MIISTNHLANPLLPNRMHDPIGNTQTSNFVSKEKSLSLLQLKDHSSAKYRIIKGIALAALGIGSAYGIYLAYYYFNSPPPFKPDPASYKVTEYWQGDAYLIDGKLSEAIDSFQTCAKQGETYCMDAIEQLKNKTTFNKQVLANIRESYVNAIDSYRLAGNAYIDKDKLLESLDPFQKCAVQGNFKCMDAIERLKNAVTIDEQVLANIRASYDQANDREIQWLMENATQSDSNHDLWLVGTALKDRGKFDEAFKWFEKCAVKGDEYCLSNIDDLKNTITIHERELSRIRGAFVAANENIIKTLKDWASTDYDLWKLGHKYQLIDKHGEAFESFEKCAVKGYELCMRAVEQLNKAMTIDQDKLSAIRDAYNLSHT